MPLTRTHFFKPALWYDVNYLCHFQMFFESHTSFIPVLNFRKNVYITKWEGKERKTSINSWHSEMVLPLFIHLINIWSVAAMYIAQSSELWEMQAPSSSLPSEKKLKIKRTEKESGGEKAKYLGETDSTNLTGHEKLFFGFLFHLKTKNHSMTVATSSLPKCQSKLLLCQDQVILYLQSFHRAYAESA